MLVLVIVPTQWRGAWAAAFWFLIGMALVAAIAGVIAVRPRLSRRCLTC